MGGAGVSNGGVWRHGWGWLFIAELRRAVDRVQEGFGEWESTPLVAVLHGDDRGASCQGLEGEGFTRGFGFELDTARRPGRVPRSGWITGVAAAH